MTLNELHELVSQYPFVPLRLHLGSMYSIDVVSPECIEAGPTPRLLKITTPDGDSKIVDVLSIERVQTLPFGSSGHGGLSIVTLTNERGMAFTLHTHRAPINHDRCASVPAILENSGSPRFTLEGTLWNLEKYRRSGEVLVMELLNGYNFVRTPRLIWRANSPSVIAMDDRWWMPLEIVQGLLVQEDSDIRLAATGLRPGEKSPFERHLPPIDWRDPRD